MAKKEKMTKTEILDKIENCIKLTIPFVAAIAGEWGLDATVYAAAIGMALIDILEVVKLFVKD